MGRKRGKKSPSRRSDRVLHECENGHRWMANKHHPKPCPECGLPGEPR